MPENEGLVFAMEANIKKLSASLAAAEARVNRTADNFDRKFQQQNQRVTAGLAQSATGFAKLGQITGAQRFVLQNTANQFGDIAVQVSSGTSAMRAMSQQLPQMLGGFGALGGTLGLVAPILGTVAAIGIPLAAVLLSSGKAAEDAAEKVKTFAEAHSEAEKALKDVDAALETLTAEGLKKVEERYGKVSDKITALIGALRDLSLAQANASGAEQLDAIFPNLEGRSDSALKAISDYQDIADRINEITDKLQGVATLPTGDVEALTEERDRLTKQLTLLKDIRAEINSIGDDLNLLPDEAGHLVSEFAKAREALRAGDFAGAADALASMREYASSVGLTMRDEVLRNITQAEDVLRAMAKQFADAEAGAQGVAGAAGGIKSPISEAADEAARLSGNLATALSVLASVSSGLRTAQRISFQRNEVLSSTVGDTGGRAAGLARVDYNERTGGAAYELIRAGRTGDVSRLADIGNQTEALAKEEAQAKATVDALDKVAKGGSGKGGKGTDFFDSVEAEILSLQRRIDLLGKTDEEIATLTTKYRLLDEAKKKGIDLDQQVAGTGKTVAEVIDQQSASVGRLTAELKKQEVQTTQVKQIQDQLVDGIVDAIVAGKDFSDVLRQITADLGKLLIKRALFGEDGSSGLLGGLVNAVVGGLSKSAEPHALGGPVSAGAPYLVGENGPELMVPSSSGTIIPNHKLGRGGGTVRLIVEEAPGFAARVRAEATDVSVEVTQRSISAYDKRQLPQRVSDIRSDPRRR